ncbi:DoxX family protein [Flavitalea flava]
MSVSNNFKWPSLFLRLAISVPYLWFVADRLGFLGKNGSPHVGWGDWLHFMIYARQTMSFLPGSLIPVFAALATLGEFLFGILLLTGLFTRAAALGSGILSLLFALSMAVSFGIESPLGYSVFTVSAASFLLASLPEYQWSIDNYLGRK